MPQPETAVATRDEHPIITQIDAKMPAIAKMLPAGMDSDRFRGIVLKAMLKNPELWACTPASVVDAVTDAAEAGLEPTGALGRAWLLPYNTKQSDGSYAKKAQLIIGYRGYAELAWRADKTLLNADAVRSGDGFSYQRGTDPFLRHVPDLEDTEREASDANITYVYAVATFPDGRTEWEVMSRAAVERIAERAKKKNPVWASDWGEMAKKTVMRRLLKKLPLSAQITRYLARDEEIDFDTPVERVPDPKRDGLRERISQRTAALRGESTGESEGSEVDGARASADQPEEEAVPSRPAVNSSSGGSPAKGDPWMRRIHALGNERGMDHDALHDWAVEHFRVRSLNDLTPPQRATFTEIVEGLPLMPQPEAASAHAAPATDTPDPEGSTDASVSGQATPEAGSLPAEPPAAQPTMQQVLDITGGEEIVEPPRPNTDQYRALPANERAQARAFWSEREKAAPKGAREPHEASEVPA